MSRIAALREEKGGAHPRAVTKVKDYLEENVQAFIRNAPFAVMATSNADGDCDASPKGGKPGFVKIVDERTLLVPDIGGNWLFQSFTNFESNPKAGFVFMIPGLNETVRVNGRVKVIDQTEAEALRLAPEVNKPDHNSGVTQGFLLMVDEAYFHCPRAFRFANLWDAEEIAGNTGRAAKALD